KACAMGAGDDSGKRKTLGAFGQLVKRLRIAADLTQEELAERAGVSARLISDLERGTIHRPRRDTVQMLADALALTDAARDSFVALARGPSAATTVPASAELAWRRSLPVPPTPIVGRLKETAALTALLLRPETRLLTLIGPGGVGKTRLALEVAARAAAAFPDGVWFVELAPVADAALVVPVIAKTLGLRETGERPLVDRLVDALHGRRPLVVIDNVEHLTAAAPALGDLLAACAGLTILATSRQPLRLRAEREYAVDPLALPDLERLPPVGDLARIPAVDLFVRRAEAARPSFALTTENAPIVAEIAVRLDGLPLAIELAAARAKVLPAAGVLTRLERRLPLLTGGPRDMPARQQTLRATLDWSHHLLSPDEQALFRRLAVFAGGFTLEAAEQVGGGRPPPVLDLLASLVDQSLLRVLDSDEDAPRFRMLETMREYAGDRLREAGEEHATQDRLAAWCLTLAERAEPELAGPAQERWLRRLTAEHDNLRAALAWAISRGDAATALRLAGALERFWTTQGLLGEGRRWLEQALGIDRGVAPAARVKALAVAGLLAYYQGDYDRTTALAEETRQNAHAIGNQIGAGIALMLLGDVAEAEDDFAGAATLFEEALALFRQAGAQSRVGTMINRLGLVVWRQGDLGRAVALHEAALALRREMGDHVGVATSLMNLGLVVADLGDYERAAALQAESLTLDVEVGFARGLPDNLENFARIAEAIREDERAARLFGAAEALRIRLGFPWVPFDRDDNQRLIAGLRERLGETAFAAAWDAGRAMSLDDAIAVALETGRDRRFDARESNDAASRAAPR
ncbi:MAG TPA: tetratricopeptide repeat protein, partial [Thermomicrobiales bacterium]|nr:tetratricopeptide repeat protein [Thermomicrobiales bacterium]